jgi:polyhydroxybutyrate depolymerase
MDSKEPLGHGRRLWIVGILLGAAGCGVQSAQGVDASVPWGSGGAGSGGASSGGASSGGASSGGASSSGASSSGAIGPESDGGGNGEADDGGSDDAAESDAGGSDAGGGGGPDATTDAGSAPPSTDASSCTGSPSSTASATGYLGDWSAGDYPSDFVDAGDYLTISGVAGQMGNTRQYAVHVPAGYSKDTPVPALFCIHGFGETASSFCLDTGVAWPTKADQGGFVVIMPNGYMNSWNAGTCCGAAAQDGLDDVALIRAIFAEVGTHVNIDLGRVFATGLSNGGYLSYRLACEASDLFVAVAPGSGAVGTADAGGLVSILQQTSDMTTCAPTNKVSVLDIHGTADPLVPYADQAPSVAIMLANNGCSTSTVPATVVPSGGDTTCVSYTGCPACPNINVTACSVADGGHCWFGSSDCGTGAGALGLAFVGNNSNFMNNTNEVWDFFSGISR